MPYSKYVKYDDSLYESANFCNHYLSNVEYNELMTLCLSLSAYCCMVSYNYSTMQNKGLIFQIVYFPVQYLTVFTTCTTCSQ
jgi:hypothetical protein